MLSIYDINYRVLIANENDNERKGMMDMVFKWHFSYYYFNVFMISIIGF
jgi:hypothetical protein